MHPNSLEAYKSMINSGKKKSRSQMIFEHFYFGRKQLTDREVLRSLKPGSDNLNFCQPRITELHQNGVLEECGSRIENGMTVRVSRAVMPESQVTLF